MSKVKVITNSFNSGEWSSKMYGRSDIAKYFNACQKMTNCIVAPQGGISKRVGTKFITKVDGSRIERFIFNNDENYFVIIGNTDISVYSAVDFKLVARVNQGVYNEAQVKQLNVLQEQDTMIFTHPDVKPYRLLRDRSSGTTVWKFEPLEIQKPPYFDFENGLPVGEPRTTIQEFHYKRAGANFTFKPVLEGVEGTEITITDNPNYNDTIRLLKASIESIVVPKRPAVNVDVKIKEDISGRERKFTIEFIGGAFGPWELMESVITDGSPDVCQFSMVQTGLVKGEPVWSDTRGWPISATIHGGRLWFGGSKSRPQTLWASRSANYFNFGVSNPDELLANDALDITLADTQSNLITGLVSKENLLIFTAGGVFSVRGDADGLITPMNVNGQKESTIGARKVLPLEFDNAVMFLQSTGAQLNSIIYDFQSNSYIAVAQTLLSDHLINNPSEMSVVEAGDEYNSNYLFVLNTDGSLALFNRSVEQDVSSWTPFTYPHKVVSITSVYDKLFILYEASGKHFVDVFDGNNNVFSDGFIHKKSSTPVNTVTLSPSEEPERFQGKKLSAIVDGFPLEGLTISGNTITFPFEGTDFIIGHELPCVIKTLPFAINLKSGPTRFGKKRISQVKLDMEKVYGLNIEYAGRKYIIEERKMGFEFHKQPQAMEGVKTQRLLGYCYDGVITISSTSPMDLKLRSLQLTIKLTG